MIEILNAIKMEAVKKLSQTYGTAAVAEAENAVLINVFLPGDGGEIDIAIRDFTAPGSKAEREEKCAEVLYTNYCRAVGWLAFNGDPLPAWPEFVKEPAKEKQVKAWRELGKVALLM